MAQKKHLLLLELSDNATQAFLVNSKAQIIAHGIQALTIESPKPNWQEVKPLEITFSIRSAVEQCLHNSRIIPQSILGIGICVNSKTSLVWDKDTGLPLSKAISTFCTRTQTYDFKIKSSHLKSAIKQTTGLLPAIFYPALKFQWLVENCPDIAASLKKKKACFATIESWALYNLTGKQTFATDFSQASQYMLCNLHEKKWDSFLTKEFMLTSQSLPQLKNSAAPFGTTKGFVPLPDGIPILGIMSKEAAELYGLNALQFGECRLCYEKQGHFLINTGEQVIDTPLLNTKWIAADTTTRSSLEANIQLPNTHQLWMPSLSETLQKITDTTLKTTHSLFMVPSKNKLWTTYNNTYSNLNIFGLTDHHTPNDIAIAFVEAIAFQIKQLLNDLESQLKMIPKEIKVCGTLSSLDYLLQYQANILEIPLIRYHIENTGCLGIAFLIGNTANFFGKNARFPQKQKINKTFSPAIDPISSLALYNQWLSYWNKCNASKH